MNTKANFVKVIARSDIETLVITTFLKTRTTEQTVDGIGPKNDRNVSTVTGIAQKIII